jgi:Tol biopolymer transport system component
VTPGGAASIAGPQNPKISGDGRIVAFWSGAEDLVDGADDLVQDVFVRDLESNRTTRVSVRPDGTAGDGHSRFPSLSRDGRFVAFISEASNLLPDGGSGTFVRDMVTLTTTRLASLTYWPLISDDGRTLGAHTLTEAFLYDRPSGMRTPLVPPDGARWYWPTPSGNGRYVAVRESGNTAVIVAPLPR